MKRLMTWLSVAVPIFVWVAVASCATGGLLPAIPVFKGVFARGVLPWTTPGGKGAVQCANYGTPSTGSRLRGTVHVVHLGGVVAGEFDLPEARPPQYDYEACELVHITQLRLGQDGWYGFAFYVPRGWTAGSQSFWGITIAQFQYQLIWGAPIEFELHDNHLTLAIATGPCRSYLTEHPGCKWRSNAESYNPGNLGRRYAVPRPMRKGVWHELVMHVHWAADSSGSIQVWHRIQGASRWKMTVALRGFPTVQWDVATGCCKVRAYDKIGAYRGLAARPVSVWLGGLVIGRSFPAVANLLPGSFVGG